MQKLRLILTLLVLISTLVSATAAEPENIEKSVCGSIQEPFVFWMWSSAAGEPSTEAAKSVPNAEPIAHKTKDGRVLRGYKLRSKS